jgi:hypothetical protein
MTEEPNLDMEKARLAQVEIDAKLKQLFEHAGETLRKRMAEDTELRRLAYMILFSSRLYSWALSEISALKDMSNEMVKVLLKAQQEKALEIFEFAEMIADLQKNQMPWLESHRREAMARNKARERRISSMIAANRKKNIELPCHSMEALFECNFTHSDILVVVGERRAITPVLQLCARRHTQVGGHTVLLSANELAEPNAHRAKHVLPPQIWRNSASIYGDLRNLLSPFSKEIHPMGLLVVENLDNMLMLTPVARTRPAYLRRAFSLLQQYQLEYGGAMILGVCTDNDPPGLDKIQIYPAEILSKHVQVSWQEPKVSNIPSVLVGNDLMLMSDIDKEIEEHE